MLSFLLLFGAGSAGIYFSTRAALLEQFDHTLRAQANAIVAGVEGQSGDFDVEINEASMHEYDEGVPVNFFQLRRPDGATLLRSRTLTNTDLTLREDLSHRAKYWDMTLPTGEQGRAIGFTFWPARAQPASAPADAGLSIVFTSDRSEMDESLATLAVVLLAATLLMLLATAWIVPMVLRREFVPLDRLAEAAGRIDARSLSTRFPADGMPGELQPICQRLNLLLSRLEESFNRERRFSADLAHELRTPIAELKNLAEVALKWPDSRPAETDDDALAIAVQMEGIVTRLLELLRSERGQMICRREPVALSPLIESVWRPFGEQAEKKALKISWALGHDLAISSDPVLLRSILANLMDNAVEYTPQGGVVEIQAQTQEGRFKITVANTVDHLEAADLARLFDRFWRKDPSRSDTTHSGLGLSLARAFSNVLGAELAASFDTEQRLVLTLTGPAAP